MHTDWCHWCCWCFPRCSHYSEVSAAAACGDVLCYNVVELGKRVHWPHLQVAEICMEVKKSSSFINFKQMRGRFSEACCRSEIRMKGVGGWRTSVASVSKAVHVYGREVLSGLVFCTWLSSYCGAAQPLDAGVHWQAPVAASLVALAQSLAFQNWSPASAIAAAGVERGPGHYHHQLPHHHLNHHCFRTALTYLVPHSAAFPMTLFGLNLLSLLLLLLLMWLFLRLLLLFL